MGILKSKVIFKNDKLLKLYLKLIKKSKNQNINKNGNIISMMLK